MARLKHDSSKDRDDLTSADKGLQQNDVHAGPDSLSEELCPWRK